MFSQVPKSQRMKVDCTIYGPNLNLSPSTEITDITICSIDPGWKNFALRIEERDLRDTLNCRSIFMDKIKFKSSFGEQNKIYDEISSYLEALAKFLETCDIVIMERQMECNYKMVRVSQHILSYFRIKFPEIMFIEITAKYKTKKLCKFGHLSKTGIKKWSVVYAKELSKLRSDTRALQLLKSQKSDDYADTIVQIDAYLLELGHKIQIVEIEFNIKK